MGIVSSCTVPTQSTYREHRRRHRGGKERGSVLKGQSARIEASAVDDLVDVIHVPYHTDLGLSRRRIEAA